MRQGLLLLAAISGFLAVALGAFGAHGLKSIAPPELVAIFKLGVDYHFYHTFAIIAVALSGHWISSKLLDWAGYLFFVGILLFSGSLYLYAFTGAKWIGPITPMGGGCMLIGWTLFAIGIAKHTKQK
ncbi:MULTISPECIES: DUF423 domain-containing protein [unclassified Shewanella]|uniref:DUF423 domain-containing protein n=1 Tax=unclassified Shewanella TaxID=196818 RepID=UPI000C82946E|nr:MULTISPECIES: DUF423 domain-containing protein [unclassified Shewanella]MDO6618658.1 DUF423 domain-containing protein [Shewanella sp. 6_MG-2023]MDO6641161.1 DUF423 domain-containing protein [Shewanella sp. 5_MG-2023]MDO6678573.1 DUF423 domain-containing protein [Shewanella sp. 4_MG-2023]MDO6774685.1 DUF423 domain-containing protein [Shewanella sp. 3_MG-2023]PMG31980.1 hypothetical protein BCU94_00990 [Shewanella sp. 10N.286.52.C2]